MKKMKMIIVVLIVMLVAISTAYAVTIIKASDVMYDNSKSNGASNNVQGAIDELYSMAENAGSGSSTSSKNMIKYITNLANTDTTNLAYDETADKNLRYIGANPNNYVEFNGELWRIIGVMNNVEDESGNKASRVKIIRSQSIGNLAWDTGYENDWSKASLQKILNSGDYYNRTNSYSSVGLSEETKTMISKVKWYLGGNYIDPNPYSWASGSYIPNPLITYIRERSDKTWSSGTVVRPKEWLGNVGLMYASDYALATGIENRDVCLSKKFFDYNGVDDWKTGNCKSNSWLLDTYNKMTITSSYSNGRDIFGVYSSGIVGGF